MAFDRDRLPDPARALQALRAIPPDCNRDDWLKTAMAAKAAGLDFDAFNAWSSTAPNYKASDCMATWRSIKPNGGVGPATLFYLASANGWQDTAALRAAKPASDRPAPPAPPAPRLVPPLNGTEPERKPAPGQTAAEVWERCEPATHAHPYIKAKEAAGVPLDDLRVLPAGDALRVAGESMAGALAVPIRTLQGELQSLQLIPPPEVQARLKAAGKPTKLNLPAHSLGSGSFTVGELRPGCTVTIAEGIATAWACWQATDNPALVTFGAARFKAVAAALRQHDRQARIILCPDVGRELQAAEVANAVGAVCCNMPQGWESNADLCDLAMREGRDALELLLSKAAALHAAAPPLPLGCIFADELPDQHEAPDELVQGVLTAGACSMLYGDSNSGKTFLSIDMAAAVARGTHWLGHRTEPGLVVYVASESPASVRSRLQAYRQHHQCEVPNFAIVQAPLDLHSSDAHAEQLIELVRTIERRRGHKARLIVGDTLARLSAGANENSGEDMGQVVRRIDRIRNETGAHFLLVHHCGKSATAGARGWSGLRAAVDTEIEVSDNLTARCAEVTKQRDLATKGVRIGFKLEAVTIGTSKWGEPVSTCIVLAAEAPASTATGKRLGPVEGAVLEFLTARKTGVKKADVVKHFDGRYQRPAVYRSLRSLQAAGALHEAAGMVCAAEAAK